MLESPLKDTIMSNPRLQDASKSKTKPTFAISKSEMITIGHHLLMNYLNINITSQDEPLLHPLINKSCKETHPLIIVMLSQLMPPQLERITELKKLSISISQLTTFIVIHISVPSRSNLSFRTQSMKEIQSWLVENCQLNSILMLQFTIKRPKIIETSTTSLSTSRLKMSSPRLCQLLIEQKLKIERQESDRFKTIIKPLMVE